MVQINQSVNPDVPDAYILVQAPSPPSPTGVPTDIVAVVGTASWGPVNAPTPIAPANYAQNFGPLKARTYDMGTAVAAAALAGAQNFTCVRVTDTTDVAAAALLGESATPTKVAGGAGFAASDTVTFSNGAVIGVDTVTSGAIATFHLITQPTAETAGTLTQTATSGVGTGAQFSFAYTHGAAITSKYTGSGANGDTVTLSAGSAASSTKVTVARAGLAPEVFDNIVGTGAAFWTNLVAALNSGQSGIRSASSLVVATAGSSTAAPVNGSITLVGGSDGVATITTAVMLGVDTGTRSGMYALRGSGPGVLMLADLSDAASWPTQNSFCLSEGFYGVVTGPAGEYTNLATVSSNKQAAGVDSYGIKILVGDWTYFLDTTNGGAARMISPQGFAAGELATLLPFQSGLNKPISGIVGTQKSYANQKYAEADLQLIGANGLDIITNPCPGGPYFGLRFGKNSSSNPAIWGDNYSRMIPYLSYSFAQVAGQFVGDVITQDQANDAVACLTGFLAALANAKPVPWISNPQGTKPYSVTIDLSRASSGYEILNVRVQLGPIVFQFVVNLQAGQTVSIAPVASL